MADVSAVDGLERAIVLDGPTRAAAGALPPRSHAGRPSTAERATGGLTEPERLGETGWARLPHGASMRPNTPAEATGAPKNRESVAAGRLRLKSAAVDRARAPSENGGQRAASLAVADVSRVLTRRRSTANLGAHGKSQGERLVSPDCCRAPPAAAGSGMNDRGESTGDRSSRRFGEKHLHGNASSHRSLQGG